MPLPVHSRAEIRDRMLSYWNARYLAAKGTPLLTTPGNDAYMEADAIALVLEGYEARSLAGTKEIFPDTASDDGVLHHASVDGIPRKPATASLLSIRISGVPLQTVTWGTAKLQSPAGVQFTPSTYSDGTGTDATFDGSGNATIYLRCTVVGSAGNIANGSSLAWMTTPRNTNPMALVLSTLTAADDEEAISDLAERVNARRREKPAGANRSEWRAWCEDCSRVDEAYVYPLLHPTLGTGTPGAVTCIVLGKAPDPPTSTSTSRVLIEQDRARVDGFVRGTNDASGTPTTNGNPLFPCVLSPSDISIELPSTAGHDVTMTVNVSASGMHVPTWSGPFFTAAGSTTTTLNTTTNPITGGVVAGDWIAVESPVRGGYEYALVASTGASQIVLDPRTPLASVPDTGLAIRPSFETAPIVGDEILRIFDRLGPGDYSPPVRYPSERELGPATLYRSALIAAAIGEPGVGIVGASGASTASLTAPPTDIAATPKQLITAGTILLIPG
jgi:uncharacterized phage protein gp47/JayE